MGFSFPFLLSVLIFLPLIGAAVVLALSDEGHQKIAALATTVVVFLLSLLLVVGWQDGYAGMQFEENLPWLPAYNLRYHLGVDGISLFLVLLWACPDVTADRLLLNGLFTGWIVVGSRLEERDLVREFGDAYRDYQRKVPMLLPWPGRRAC